MGLHRLQRASHLLIGPTEMSYLPASILSVYGVLKESRRLELCQYLVNIAGEADTMVCTVTTQCGCTELTFMATSQTTIRGMLAKMIEDSSVVSSLLAWIRGSANNAAERPAKRARLERFFRYRSSACCSRLDQRATPIKRSSAHLRGTYCI
jgi:hypothetical protein